MLFSRGSWIRITYSLSDTDHRCIMNNKKISFGTSLTFTIFNINFLTKNDCCVIWQTSFLFSVCLFVCLIFIIFICLSVFSTCRFLCDQGAFVNVHHIYLSGQEAGYHLRAFLLVVAVSPFCLTVRSSSFLFFFSTSELASRSYTIQCVSE